MALEDNLDSHLLHAGSKVVDLDSFVFTTSNSAANSQSRPRTPGESAIVIIQLLTAKQEGSFVATRITRIRRRETVAEEDALAGRAQRATYCVCVAVGVVRRVSLRRLARYGRQHMHETPGHGHPSWVASDNSSTRLSLPKHVYLSGAINAGLPNLPRGKPVPEGNQWLLCSAPTLERN